MRYVRHLVVAFLVMVSFLLVQHRDAYASFHCMRIHAVMAGFNTNNNVQYVELRQVQPFQNAVNAHKIRFYDASGTLKATFTFPANVSNTSNGDSILIGTQEFNNVSTGGDADFVFTIGNTVGSNGGDPLHPVQATGGKVVFAGEAGDFNCNLGVPPVDSAAYGSFSGTVEFGTPAPALPSPSDNRALRLGNTNAKPSNNSTEYTLQAVTTSTATVSVGNLKTDVNTPRNNARQLARLAPPVGGSSRLPGIDDSTASPFAQHSESSGNAWLLATLAAGTLAILSGTAVYAWRRSLR